MLRRLVTAIVTVALALGATVALAGPAHAAKPKLTIGTIATQTVGWNETAVIKPRVTKRGPVKVSSSRLTVVRDGRAVARSKASVTLRQGTYRVTTVVKYRVKKSGRYGSVKSKKRTQTVKVTKPARCATKSDYAAVDSVEMYEAYETDNVDDVVDAVKKLRSPGREEFRATLAELHEMALELGYPEDAAFFEAVAEDEELQYGWDGVWTERTFALCKRSERALVVDIEGDVWFKDVVRV